MWKKLKKSERKNKNVKVKNLMNYFRKKEKL